MKQPAKLFAALLVLSAISANAQWQIPVGTTPDAQRSALSGLRSQINWFQNATRTAANYGDQGYGKVWEQFQALRGAYTSLKQTLNGRQLAEGANALAELDAGLDIIQQGFSNYQNDIAAGRSAYSALSDMCQVLRQATQIWAQEFNKHVLRLRIGSGLS
jgi:hypothetical protein